MKRFIPFMLIAFALLSQSVHASPQQLLQLIDYVAVDYSEAIDNGQITNEAEYSEMLDFSAGINQHLADLSDNTEKAHLIAQGLSLGQLIEEKGSVLTLRQIIADMRIKIISAYQVQVIPRAQPDLKQASLLYAQHCASCHGVSGYGDGPASIGMSPGPVDFNDVERYKHRTLYGLYNTISQGVDGTGMASYAQLTDEQRWSLAFYVGSFAMQIAGVSPSLNIQSHSLAEMKQLTTITPQQAESLDEENGALMMATLRAHPELLYDNDSKLEFSKRKLLNVLASYRDHDDKQAYQYAVEAYLDGFELVEHNINMLDSSLRLEIELAMTGLRNKIRNGESYDVIDAEISIINGQLDQAMTLLSSKTLSSEATFAAAFFILLREGLEALLIVAALAAFLVRTKRPDGLRYIHIGWISALVLGLFTWWASVELIDISGASREITEGVAAIVATIILLYVGFWMHDKTSAAKWKKFIDDSMHKALTSGTLWTLAGLSFIAVYREAFETILFYQALWVQTGETGQSMVLSGFVSAGFALAILGWLIMRYSVKLPLRQFFAVTGGLMFLLAIIFAGKGIAALQEAGVISAYSVNFIRIDLLGVYPNLQGLLVQLSLIIITFVFWNRKSKTAEVDVKK